MGVNVVVNESSSSSSSSSSTEKITVPYCFGNTHNTKTPFPFPLALPPFLSRLIPLHPHPNFNLLQLPTPITTAADTFFPSLHSFISRNPILNKLSSHFHSFSLQIRCSNMKMRSFSSTHNFAAVLPGDSMAGLVVANGIQSFLSLYNTLLVVRLVLTWFPNSPPAIVSPLSTLCDPYLNLFRGLIPPIGGTLDLSPILAFLVLNAFTSTAAALPAELPVAEQSQQGPAAPLQSTNVLTSQKEKWLRRIQGNRSRTSGRVN